MTSQAESSSSASRRERLKLAGRRLANRSRSGFSHADTPLVGGASSLRGTAVNVLGESGGGPFYPKV